MAALNAEFAGQPQLAEMKPFVSAARKMMVIYSVGQLGHCVISPPSQAATGLQYTAVIAVVSMGLVAGLAPLSLGHLRLWRSVAVCAFAVSAWQILCSAAESLAASRFAWMTLGDHATRYTLPFLLGYVLWKSVSAESDPAKAALPRNVLRLGCLAVATTFTVHGIKSLCHVEAFSTLITDGARRTISLGIADFNAQKMLTIIGLLDLAAVAMLAFGLRKLPLRYLFVWGFLSAWSRTAAAPYSQAWDEPLIRVANGGLPLLMLLVWREFSAAKDEQTKKAAGPNAVQRL